jgi:hypothetical protein
MVVTDSVAKLEVAQRSARSGNWAIAILQAAISGMVAALTVLAVLATR